eukprot:scaffold91994_cov63-Phaeocystis_antarctica.AAC.2
MRCASCARDYAHGPRRQAACASGPQLPCLLEMAAASLSPFPRFSGRRLPSSYHHHKSASAPSARAFVCGLLPRTYSLPAKFDSNTT